MNPTSEQALAFDCCGDTLVGVLTVPEHAPELGLVVVVGGPQYRAGSHRHFVQLARRAAAEGFAVLRFDCRGMGDSTGTPRTFEQLDDDIGTAIDAIQRAMPSIKRVVLWGLCDAASAALLYLDRRHPDARVAGLCLLNPWVRSATTLARVHVKHYYLQRMREGAFWLKVLRGGVAWQALRGLATNLRQATRGARSAPAGDGPMFPERMARAWAGFGGKIQLVLSGNDLTAKEFEQALTAEPYWRSATQAAPHVRFCIDEADHTFSSSASARRLELALVEWLRSTVCLSVKPGALT